MLPARRQGLLQTGLQQVTPNAPGLVRKKNNLDPKKHKSPLNSPNFPQRKPDSGPLPAPAAPPGVAPTARPRALTASRPRRLFGIKCAQCRAAFSSSDLVMRARDHVYHLECFRCAACGRQLLPGDQFCLRERDLLCRADHGPPPDGAAARGPRSPALPPAAAAHLAGTGSAAGRAAGRGGCREGCGGRAGGGADGARPPRPSQSRCPGGRPLRGRQRTRRRRRPLACGRC